MIPITVFAVVTPLPVHGPGGGTVTSVFIIFAFLVVFIFQMLLLITEGQTVGIRIVKIDTGQNGGFVPNVLLRLIVNGLIEVIPFYGLVDILFIFRGRINPSGIDSIPA